MSVCLSREREKGEVEGEQDGCLSIYRQSERRVCQQFCLSTAVPKLPSMDWSVSLSHSV